MAIHFDTAPDLARIKAGDPQATEDAISMIWLGLTQLILQEQGDIYAANSLSQNQVSGLATQVTNLTTTTANLATTTAALTALTNSFTWVSVPYAAGLFTTNGTGAITPTNANFRYVYAVINKILIVDAFIEVTINNATTTEVRLAVPAGLSVDTTTGNGGAGVFNGPTNTGVALWTAGGTNPNAYFSVQRWDGAAAAGYANGDTVFIRFNGVGVLL